MWKPVDLFSTIFDSVGLCRSHHRFGCRNQNLGLRTHIYDSANTMSGWKVFGRKSQAVFMPRHFVVWGLGALLSHAFFAFTHCEFHPLLREVSSSPRDGDVQEVRNKHTGSSQDRRLTIRQDGFQRQRSFCTGPNLSAEPTRSDLSHFRVEKSYVVAELFSTFEPNPYIYIPRTIEAIGGITALRLAMVPPLKKNPGRLVTWGNQRFSSPTQLMWIDMAGAVIAAIMAFLFFLPLMIIVALYWACVLGFIPPPAVVGCPLLFFVLLTPYYNLPLSAIALSSFFYIVVSILFILKYRLHRQLAKGKIQ